MTLRRPSVFGGAIAGSISTSFGLRNFVSSSRPCPSGVRIITMSTWTLSSPLTRSTHGPSTGASPSSVMPSAVKKARAPARSSTTTLTWSNLLIVMSLGWSRAVGHQLPTPSAPGPKWAHLVGALRVYPHKHWADYPPQEVRGTADFGIAFALLRAAQSREVSTKECRLRRESSLIIPGFG